jgi:inner membrane protein
LLLGALWGIRKRTLIRRALLTGAAVALLYLAARIGIRADLASRVRAAYPNAETAQVFPSWLGPTHWRYVAVFPDRYSVGRIDAFGAPEEQASHRRSLGSAGRALTSSNPTVREALAWARFPVVEERPRVPSGVALTIADLRYHLNGAPTLAFRIELDDQARVVSAALDRGGSARSLWQRFRSPR